MIGHDENLLDRFSDAELKKFLSLGKIGIEKESLRVFQGKISQSKHFDSVGSALCNRYITTDFSEALLELITPPYENNIQTLEFLDNVHHFVTHNVEDDLLWPFSMPPSINSESEILIAEYGVSNQALFKRIYREGLSHRYGKLMQVISGLHFNYSLPEIFWTCIKDLYPKYKTDELSSIIYFRTLRNLKKMNWLILLLFGASPVISKNFLHKDSSEFKKFKGGYYLPYATSLRMSDLGYQNFNRSTLNASLNSLDEYTEALLYATGTESEEYKKIFDNESNQYPQLNSNLLQIEDEYYSIARPKSNNLSNIRLLKKLKSNGVDYIEFRSLDLNPFHRSGIDLNTINFMEIFLIYCSLIPSPPITDEEIQEFNKNDLKVAREGRRKGLKIIKEGKLVLLRDWAHSILDEMSVLSNLSGDDNNGLEHYKDIISNPNLSLSGILLDNLFEKNISFQEMGIELAETYKEQFLQLKPSENIYWDYLKEEAISSLKEQDNLEQKSKETFEEYLMKYLE